MTLMVLGDETTRRLLGAIETDSLAFICGAGLSMPAPSNLLSAVRVSQDCFDARAHIEALDPALRDDIDRLAGHFHARGEFETVFLGLVPWDDLVGSPNSGHAAVADLLISRGVHGALSANFDSLIERWAEERKVDMRGALTGVAAANTTKTNPLIKFHGCMHQDRGNTIWTHGQLTDPVVLARVESCKDWMRVHLPGKHLLVVGFWTDWGYLNDVLAEAFATMKARSVTVVDPKLTADLMARAPTFWATLNDGSDAFEHLQASGGDALDDLRVAYSRTWARKFYALGQNLALAAGAAPTAAAPFDALDGDALYNLRRDSEGEPYNRAAKLKAPPPSAAHAACVHALLLNAGATRHGAWMQHGGRLIRVVNGAGRGLADVRGRYKEPAVLRQADIVVCAGAIDLGVPAKLIDPGRGASTIRPAPGGDAEWLTFDRARMELGI